MSHNKHTPTENDRRQVLTMAAMGIMLKDICTVMQLDPTTLKRHYRRELDTADIEANVRVAQALYKNAVNHNNVTAQIWWTKSRMGWKDSSEINLTANDITFQHLIAAKAASNYINGTVIDVEPEPADGEDTNVSTEQPRDLMEPAEE
jgi:hypothetical protein